MRRIHCLRGSALGLVCLLVGGVLFLPGVPAAESLLRPPATGGGRLTTLPSGFTQEVLVAGLQAPTVFAPLPDGRILIAEKSGVVKVYKNGAVLGTPFIDLRSRVNDYWDRGLLGMAIDPDFARNGFVYLLYVYENDAGDYQGPKTGRLGRFTAVGDVASPDSEAVLLGSHVGRSCKDFPAGTDCLPSDGPSHSVGNLEFAPDGTLFVTLGDSASFSVVDTDALRAQNLDSLSGKLLHITTAGAGLPTNPFWNGDPSANRSKVWSYGLRNPFRFTLRPGSGIPYVGDVGWGDAEEIDVATPGANLGWPCYEGPGQQSGYAALPECQALYALGPSAVKMPLYSWPHDGLTACSVAGVFRSGLDWPAPYQDVFFFGDYAQGWMRALRVDAQDNLLGVSDFASASDGVVDFELGPDGNLYSLDVTRGELRRIRYVGANSPPIASASATPTNGSAPLSVQFSSAGSSDPEGAPLSFLWDFGDGTPHSCEPAPLHTYIMNGTFTARLLVSDGMGGSSSATVVISVGNHAPTAAITAPSSSHLFSVGEVLSFSGSATDPEDGTLPEANLAWNIILHHCPGGACHPHPFLSRTGSGGSFVVPDHGDDSFFELRLTATDRNGLSDTKSVVIQPRTVQLTLDTSPPGMQVVYDGTAGTAPLVRTTIVGAHHTLFAPSPQGDFTFQSWSDGGDAQHEVVIGESDAVYVAAFAPPAPVVCPSGQFRAEYFNNRDLSGTPTVVRCESAPLSYDWGSDAPPDTGVGADEFSVRWTGRFFFPAGFYRFTARADDGVRLWVDGGSPLIDGWRDQSATTYYGYVFLLRGEHEVTLEYYEAGGDAVSQLRWAKVW